MRAQRLHGACLESGLFGLESSACWRSSGCSKRANHTETEGFAVTGIHPLQPGKKMARQQLLPLSGFMTSYHLSEALPEIASAGFQRTLLRFESSANGSGGKNTQVSSSLNDFFSHLHARAICAASIWDPSVASLCVAEADTGSTRLKACTNLLLTI